MAPGGTAQSRSRARDLIAHRRSGTSLEQALRDSGATLPSPPIPPAAGTSRTAVHRHRARPAGAAGPATGGRPPGHRLAGYEVTSDQTPVLWPLIAGQGLPPTGAPMGFDVLSGGSFYCDPMGWVTDDTIPVTNPNVFVFGKPGRGKSALVKALPAPDDPLRLPHPRPRRRQGRVRRHRPRPRRRPLPHRTRPPRTHQPPRPRTPRRRLGRPRPRRDPPPQRRPPDPLARPRPRPRRLPTRPVHPHREPHHLQSAARPHRLGPRAKPNSPP